jgi:hypothetical protein
MFVWTVGCTSYKQIDVGDVADHGRVRVTQTDGTKRDFYRPVVESDSIKGEPRKQPDPRYYDAIVYVIPLDQVSRFESVGTDEVGTVLTILGVTVGVIALFLFMCPPLQECRL